MPTIKLPVNSHIAPMKSIGIATILSAFSCSLCLFIVGSIAWVSFEVKGLVCKGNRQNILILWAKIGGGG